MASEREHLEFEAAIAQHVPALVSYLAGLTRRRAEAEELAQEALVRAFHAFPRFRAEPGGPDRTWSWLRTIAVNRWRTAARDRGRRRTVALDEAAESSLDAFYADVQRHGYDLRQHLARCFDELPESLAAPCRMHYHEEHPVRTIAEQMGLSIDAALKRLQRARDLLRDCIRGRLKQVGDER